MKSAVSKFIAPCAFWLLVGAGLAQADVVTYTALPLTGSQQVPAVATTGYGWFTGTYDTASKALTFSFNWQLGGSATLSGVHFHGPATVGQNAAVVVPVTGAAAANYGNSAQTVTLTAAQEADLLAGKWYFNVHSTTNPGGEVRGQMIADSGGPNAPYFSSAAGLLTLPSVMLPQAGAYSAQLQLVPGSSPVQFQLQSATQLR
ncbi:MAG: CHRD domain-containing protein [Sulfuricella sp.]|nr:CHRD domain-containing protein [Sulfuricella sp.]